MEPHRRLLRLRIPNVRLFVPHRGFNTLRMNNCRGSSPFKLLSVTPPLICRGNTIVRKRSNDYLNSLRYLHEEPSLLTFDICTLYRVTRRRNCFRNAFHFVVREVRANLQRTHAFNLYACWKRTNLRTILLSGK